MKMVFRFSCVFTFLLLLLLPAVGQDSSAITGGLSGVVTDTSGAVVPGATVTLTGPQGTIKLTTDKLGRYAASTLRPGTYDVKVEKAGFNTVESKHNEVVVSVSSTLNLAMSVGDVSTTVEVNASAVAIDTTSTAITSTLTDTFYNSVPMPRNVSAIFYAAPGVAGGDVASTPNETGSPGAANPSIGGASALENLYVVDGVTITDQAFGSIGTYNRYHGSLGTGINLAFIKEVDVKTTAFEPAYGMATGGIVQIVTKSGGNEYHGAVSAYFAPDLFYAPRYQFYQFGYQQLTPFQTLSSPAFDAAVELGGYVPHMKNKLFFFGAFDPSLNTDRRLANPAVPATYSHGIYDYNTTGLSWAGKLTYKLNDTTTFEVSSFGDPSRHNTVPFTLSTSNPLSVSSSYNFGSRNSVARLNTAITSSWSADVTYAYNHNHFSETPATNDYGIGDYTPTYLPQPGAVVNTGFGPYEPSVNNTYSIAANTTKIAHLFGQHTISAGYFYDHTSFLDLPSRSGSLFAIPSANYQGTSLTSLFSNIPAGAIGSMTNAQFHVVPANPNNLGDRTCAMCPQINGITAYASIYRGTYQGLDVNAFGRYHAAYGEDVYEVNKYITLNGGVRWEEQRIGGDLLNYAFTGSWSPRVGINIDPLGDRKSKLFFNFGRNYWAMPLDAAIRQLGNEQDDTSFAFAPTLVNGQLVVIPDQAHLLSGTPQATAADGTVTNFGGPNFSSSTGEGIIPGTKSEYEDEYVAGFERNLSNSVVIKMRYTDRRLGRIIEDIGSQSPEGSTVDAHYNGGISNPGPSTDIAVNEQEVTYTPAQFKAVNPGTVTKANYKAPVAGCTAANDTYLAVGGFFINSTNQPVGGACILNAATAGAGPGDGIPDGFAKPVRRYNAIEFEMDKRFSNHWLAVANFKWGNLYGNYEGAYRNDNGQSDPGISSLFDFTPGKLGLLGDQFTPGPLSTDRRTVGNIFLSYNIGSDTPFIHGARGLTIGLGARGQSGVPLSLLGDHPIYLNQGEIPVGGRGAAGRTPSTTQLDMHLDYAVPLGARFAERYHLKLAMDMFNVTNSQFETSRVQFLQTTASAVGQAPALNVDYGRPTGFQGPFYARGTVRFEF